MESMKNPILAVLSIVLCIQSTNAQPHTGFKMNEDELTRYVSRRFDYLKDRVGRLPGYKINAYADWNLRKVYDKEEAIERGASCETVTLQNPNNPNDPYDTIDTTVCTLLDPFKISAWVLRQGKTFKSNKWQDVKAIGVFFNTGFDWDTTGNAITGGRDSFLYYIRKSDFESTILPEEGRMLQAYLDYVNPAGKHLDSVVISYPLLKDFIQGWYDSVSTGLYRNILLGRITPYWRDTVNRAMTPDEVQKIGGYCATVEVQINPDDPYDVIDSVVCTAFDPRGLTGLAVSHEWDLKDINPTAQLRGIGLLYRPVIGEVELPDQTMFWMHSEDVKKSLREKDWLVLTDMLNFQLLWSVQEEYYWR
jgi:hypothetical protein